METLPDFNKITFDYTAPQPMEDILPDATDDVSTDLCRARTTLLLLRAECHMLWESRRRVLAAHMPRTGLRFLPSCSAVPPTD